jgi:hypothetical protein
VSIELVMRRQLCRPTTDGLYGLAMEDNSILAMIQHLTNVAVPQGSLTCYVALQGMCILTTLRSWPPC